MRRGGRDGFITGQQIKTRARRGALLGEEGLLIRDFPDHATFMEKGAKLACADKLGVFLLLTLCNKANFDLLQRGKYDGS